MVIHSGRQCIGDERERSYARSMSPDAAEILRHARMLEHDELAQLVEELIHVLDERPEHPSDSAELSDGWRREIQRRLRDIDQGGVDVVDGRESLSRVRAALDLAPSS